MHAPLGFTFNAAAVEPTAPMGAVPAGTYNVMVEKAELIPVKSDASQSQYELEFVIIDGQYKGRKGWMYLNIHNPDEQKRAMAQGDLSAICRAVNVIQLNDMTQLCGRPLTCDFKLVKGTEQYPDDKNKLRNFKPYAGSAGAPVATAPGLPGGFVPAAPGFAPMAPTLPQAPASFAPAAPLAPPPTMPQGFQVPGQQTAQFAPPMAPAPAAPMQQQQFAPPAPPQAQYTPAPVAPAPTYQPAPGFAAPPPPPGMPQQPAWSGMPPQG